MKKVSGGGEGPALSPRGQPWFHYQSTVPEQLASLRAVSQQHPQNSRPRPPPPPEWRGLWEPPLWEGGVTQQTSRDSRGVGVVEKMVILGSLPKGGCLVVGSLVEELDGEHEVQVATMAHHVTDAPVHEVDLAPELFGGRSLDKLDALGAHVGDAGRHLVDSVPLVDRVSKREHVARDGRVLLAIVHVQLLRECSHFPLRGTRALWLKGRSGREDAHLGEEGQHRGHETAGAQFDPACFGVGDDAHRPKRHSTVQELDHGALQGLEMRADLFWNDQGLIQTNAVLRKPSARKQCVVPVKDDNCIALASRHLELSGRCPVRLGLARECAAAGEFSRASTANPRPSAPRTAAFRTAPPWTKEQWCFHRLGAGVGAETAAVVAPGRSAVENGRRTEFNDAVFEASGSSVRAAVPRMAERPLT
jgi:hypothetical protein